MTDDDYMKLAIQKAGEGIMQGQTPFGSCIVRDERVLGCAHNAVWASVDITAHAEILALREACTVPGSIDLTGGDRLVHGMGKARTKPAVLASAYKIKRIESGKMRKKETFESALLEERHKKGYERHPVGKTEFSIREDEQEWGDNPKSEHPVNRPA